MTQDNATLTALEVRIAELERQLATGQLTRLAIVDEDGTERATLAIEPGVAQEGSLGPKIVFRLRDASGAERLVASVLAEGGVYLTALGLDRVVPLVDAPQVPTPEVQVIQQHQVERDQKRRVAIKAFERVEIAVRTVRYSLAREHDAGRAWPGGEERFEEAKARLADTVRVLRGQVEQARQDGSGWGEGEEHLARAEQLLAELETQAGNTPPQGLQGEANAGR